MDGSWMEVVIGFCLYFKGRGSLDGNLKWERKGEVRDFKVFGLDKNDYQFSVILMF